MLFRQQGRSTNFLDFLGVSEELDEVVNRLLEDENIQEVLFRSLGPGYWLAFAQIRRAELNSAPLRVHTDTPDGLVISILLSEVASKHGTTAFLRGSHRWPQIINNFLSFSPFFPLWRTDAAEGTAGDMYFFYTETWHGATPAVGAPATAILLTFLSAREEAAARMPSEERASSLGPVLNQVLWRTDRNCRKASRGSREAFLDRETTRVLPWNSGWRLLVVLAVLSGFVLAQYRKVRTAWRKSLKAHRIRMASRSHLSM